MKHFYFTTALLFAAFIGQAQITIDANDLPSTGDTLRFSSAAPASSNINLSNTGAGITWDFTSLVPIDQGIEKYETASDVSFFYGMQFGSGSYGHLVDPLFFPVPLPPMVQNPYFFYTKSNTEFTLEGYGLEFNGTPVPLAFQDADEVLFLPATFGNDDSSTFKLDFSLAGNRVKQEGYRKTVVDGHGTIETPYTTSPVQCLRVRSFVDEIDTIETGGTVIGIPRTYVDYKWLAENEKFPLLWVRTEVVAGSEQIVLISFRDHYRPSLGIASLTPSLTRLEAWPVPATNEVNISLPTDWKQYLLTVYDLNGRPITTQSNSPVINLEALPAGTYIIRAVSGTESGFTTVTKR